jgi:hypothetical protein
MLPISWHVFALWVRQPEDDPATDFEQQWELLAPSGRMLVSSISPRFRMERQFHRVSSRLIGFPIGETGEHLLRLQIRNATANEQFRQVAEYPVPISVLVAEAAHQG